MRPGLDVYLMPAVVGGGLGDIDEVLVAGDYLRRAGFALTVYRPTGRPWPKDLLGPWDWPRHRRSSVLRPRAPRALTVSPCWGVSAAPSRDEPFGRGGPWELEATEVERRYGPEATVHVSLEEFARTLTSRQESVERWREGGIGAQEIRARRRRASFRTEARTFHREYRRFRAFDRPNVLHLYATFAPSRSFAREYPQAVQCGPLWPIRRFAAPGPRTTTRPSWVWYASPSSAERIASRVLQGLAGSPRHPRLVVRAGRPWKFALPSSAGVVLPSALRPERWSSTFDRADLRIVTGSRTLLEAIRLGRPLLYFNGTLGTGRRTHRHRPEKIDRLLAAGPFSAEMRRDLGDFARGRRVETVVRRAAERRGGWASFPRGPWTRGFVPPYESAGGLVVHAARAFANGEGSSSEIVAAIRAHAPPRRS